VAAVHSPGREPPRSRRSHPSSLAGYWLGTSANLDLARSIFAAWERADYSTTDWAHDDIEFVIAEGPSPGRWTGPAEMAKGYREWLTAWEAYRVKAEEYRELDSERVLVLVRATGRGKTSGLDIEQIQSRGGAGLFHIRSGKVARYVIYWDRAHALADLGLQE
jgi:ketosteroid isomerase-like protein